MKITVIKKRFCNFKKNKTVKGTEISSFEKIGYVKNLPKDTDNNDFETISVNTKNGEQVKLYRSKEYKNERDEKLNFRNSWEVFNSIL